MKMDGYEPDDQRKKKKIILDSTQQTRRGEFRDVVFSRRRTDFISCFINSSTSTSFSCRRRSRQVVKDVCLLLFFFFLFLSFLFEIQFWIPRQVIRDFSAQRCFFSLGAKRPFLFPSLLASCNPIKPSCLQVFGGSFVVSTDTKSKKVKLVVTRLHRPKFAVQCYTLGAWVRLANQAKSRRRIAWPASRDDVTSSSRY